jgi:hypothetical protein
MRPWQHARASAQRAGRDWRSDLPIHEFLDLTKAACPDLRHRMILHNSDLGPALASLAFASRPEAASVALRHVWEDMRGEPKLASWLAGCDLARLPAPPLRRRNFAKTQLVELICREQRLADDCAPRQVLDLLLMPTVLAPECGDAALAVLCNGIGPVVARHVWGMPREVPGRSGTKAVFDPGWTAEAMIYWIMDGHIPSLASVLDALHRMPAPAE